MFCDAALLLLCWLSRRGAMMGCGERLKLVGVGKCLGWVGTASSAPFALVDRAASLFSSLSVMCSLTKQVKH